MLANLLQMMLSSGGTSSWSTPDFSTASYDSVSKTFGTTYGAGMCFSPDGTKLFYTYSSNGLRKFQLSTPWDLSTISIVQANTSVVSYPKGIFVSPDGVYAFITHGVINSDITRLTMSTPWDLSTASVTQTLSVYAQEHEPTGIYFSEDGHYLFYTGTYNDKVSQHYLSSPWDLSTESLLGQFSVNSQTLYPMGLFVAPDGNSFYISSAYNDRVIKYNMASSWDVTSASYTFNDYVDVSSQSIEALGVWFKPDGKKMYVMDAINTSNAVMYQYSV